MIQFNLLPDVKLEYVKAQRTKRLVMSFAVIATISSFALFALLFIAVNGVQKKSMGDLEDDITKYSNQLKDIPDLNKILTIQNQVGALDGLHSQKVVTSRMFGLVQETTPADVTISDYGVDFAASTMTISGGAPSLDKVNTYVDTLKFATFTKDGDSGVKAFSNVVMSQFGRSEVGTTYSVTLGYDPALFSGEQDIKLIIPKTVTTRSVVEQPGALFQSSTTTNKAGN